VLRVVAWLPLAFGIWFFVAPILLAPARWAIEAIVRTSFGDLVQGIEQTGSVLVFLTTLRPGSTTASVARITVEVNALLYAVGWPLFAALTLAAAEPRRTRVLMIGYVALLPVIVWGVIADLLKNIAITAGPVVASQAGFSAAQRELIAFAFQFGSLILPTVVPAVVWVLTHRRFLERLRAHTAPA
jgi:hypothetical protein